MKIIGHRGAAGSELENTLASLQIAMQLGVAGIEVDIRKTKDNRLVLCHDADLARVAEDGRKIADLTLKQLQKIPLLSGASIPTLEEAFEVVGKTPLFIELKETGCTELLLKVLARFPDAQPRVLSFMLDELALLREKSTTLVLYGSEKTKPFDVIQMARSLRLNGVCLNYWLLNPLTYWLCRFYRLDLMVYTVNKRFMGKFIGALYPNLKVCTDYPEKFLHRKRHFISKRLRRHNES